MASVTTKKISNITFGYSDSEDRMWLRLLLTEGGEAKMWLTRRLCQGLCNGIANVIEQHTVVDNEKLTGDTLAQHLKTEFYETTRSTWDPAPPPGKKEDITIPMGLCHTIYIDSTGSTWCIRLVGPNHVEYALMTDRRLIQKTLLAIYKQAQQAGWNIATTHDWLRL